MGASLPYVPLGRRFWGALDGQELRGPESRRASLAQLSFIAASSGVVTGAFLRRLLSGWIHCLLARRVLRCLIGDAFRALPDLENDNRVFLLTPKIRCEILLLAVWLQITTNLRAQHSDCLVAIDASEHGLGACTTSVDPALHAEFSRHREQRGAYTWLAGPAASCLYGLGPAHEVEDLDEMIRSAPAPIGCVMIETFDFIDEVPMRLMARPRLLAGPSRALAFMSALGLT